MSFYHRQFRELIIRPSLQALHDVIPYSEEAEDLLFMTAAHESRLGTYLKQINGPALGVYQMEPATHNDIWDNFLTYRESIIDCLRYYFPHPIEMIHDLQYATAMARVHYFRVKEALPKKSDYANPMQYLPALARYAKKYYNTELGKATVDDYVNAYIEFNRGAYDR